MFQMCSALAFSTDTPVTCCSDLFFMRERHSFAIKRETGVQLVELSLDAAPTSALAQAYKRSISRISLNSESCKATLESKNEKNMQLEMS